MVITEPKNMFKTQRWYSIETLDFVILGDMWKKRALWYGRKNTAPCAKTLTNLINTYLVSISIGISLTATDRKTQSTSGISAIELYFFPHEILLGQQSCLNLAALLHEVLRNLIFWLSTACPASLWVKMIAFTFQAAG